MQKCFSADRHYRQKWRFKKEKNHDRGLDSLGEAGRMRNAPTATITGDYAAFSEGDSVDREHDIKSFALMPCKLTGLVK